ncbi:MAG: hypothetical protein ACR2P3_08715 [Geminicoccaceae bacterium]
MNDEETSATTAAEAPDSLDPASPLAIAKTEMVEGEQLIWAETPSAASVRRRTLPISLLGGLFLFLTLTWMAKAATASFWLLILGLAFLCAAFALLLLPWWWPRITRHTVYAISDQRLLIIQEWPKRWQGWPRRRVTSYGPDDIDVVERRERRDGSGDLIFRREAYRRLRHHHDPQGKRRVGERVIGFFGVPDVRRLEEAILALKQPQNADLATNPAKSGAETSDRADDNRGHGRAKDPAAPTSTAVMPAHKENMP